jgi:nitrous oxide reductase
MKDETPKSSKRRDFLKLAGIGAGVAGAAAVGRVVPQAKAAAPASAPTGYRESEQVKTYYRLARF